MVSPRREVQLSLAAVLQQFTPKKLLPTFLGGVHPPESKSLTADLAIRQFPFASVMNIPLNQHIGKPSIPIVREGQEVTRGQLLAEPDGFMSVALHSPASGVIKSIGLMPSINGKMVMGIYLQPFPGSTQEVADGKPCLLAQARSDEIVQAIQMAGIVGLGGAAFPTHAKLKAPEGKSIDTLIINGAECEPYLTNDYRIMLEQSEHVITGIGYLLKATKAKKAIIGIEDNKQPAAQRLKIALQNEGADFAANISIELVQTKYPQGAEKTLITALLGKQVPSYGLPLDVGVVVVNVTSAAEIGRLLPQGRGIQERVITISGPGVKKPGNYQIPIGTPLRFALEYVGVSDALSQVYLGGPMMGQALPSLDISITKGTSGFVAFTNEQTGSTKTQYPCIHCSYCIDACPMHLNPSQLGILAANKRYQTMADQYHLMACFECGSCAFVCPSNLPLVQQFRVAKNMIRKGQAEQ
jgi:electron transport complex protein RnfC